MKMKKLKAAREPRSLGEGGQFFAFANDSEFL
jgi:hypothetical protein